MHFLIPYCRKYEKNLFSSKKVRRIRIILIVNIRIKIIRITVILKICTNVILILKISIP